MIKKIFNFLLNLVMSFLVLGLICINLISNTIFNKEYIKEKLIENNFYERTYGDIKIEFENYTMQSGLELEILDDLISQEKVTSDINLKIDSIYSGKKVDIETDSIREELDSRINSILEKNNRVPTAEEKKSINTYEDVIVDCYKTGILYGRDFDVHGEFLKIAKIICIVHIVIISVILLIINRNILKYSSLVGINLLFSGILCMSVKHLLEKRIQHILILDAKFSNFLVNSLNDIIEKFHQTGITILIIGCILIVIGSFEKMKKTIENNNE